MDFYAVLEGGGVKGAALAGGLAAAEEQNIKFKGFGGSSAGAIVALLAAAGFSGEEIGKQLIETELTSFLTDEGRSLNLLRTEVGGVGANLNSNIFSKLLACRRMGSLAKKYWSELGVYDTSKMKQKLHELVCKALEKHQLPKAQFEKFCDDSNFSFRDFAAIANTKPLRVVASDVLSCRSCIFDVANTPSHSVLNAVCASASYPLVFKPTNSDGKQLLDGGIASNLPVFLFDREYRASRIPTLAFALETDCEQPPPIADLYGLVQQMLMTAVEASDSLLLELVPGIYHIRIKTPPDIRTLDFNISSETKKQLFTVGYRDTSRYVATMDPVKHARLAGAVLQKQLININGPFPIYEAMLAAVAREVVDIFNSKNVRASLLLPTPRSTLMVTYYAGFEKSHADVDLELEQGQGAAWIVWRQMTPFALDLVEAASDPGKYCMNSEIQAKIPKDRKSLACIAVPARPTEDDSSGILAPLGVLAVDSSSELSESQWTKEDGQVDEGLADILKTWAEVIGRVLPLQLPRNH